MESECHRLIMESDPQLKFNVRTAQECICDCIKECKVLECICPVCTGFKYKLQAWYDMRNEARKTEICSCSLCIESSKWRTPHGLSAWRCASTCGKFPHPNLENPADGSIPMFNRLTCCLCPKKMTKKRKKKLVQAMVTQITIRLSLAMFVRCVDGISLLP